MIELSNCNMYYLCFQFCMLWFFFFVLCVCFYTIIFCFTVAADAVDLLTFLTSGDLSHAAYLISWLEAMMAALQFIFNPVCG